MSYESDVAIVAAAFNRWTEMHFPGWEGGLFGYRSSSCSQDGKLQWRKHRCPWCIGGSEWIDEATPIPHSDDCPEMAVKRVMEAKRDEPQSDGR